MTVKKEPDKTSGDAEAFIALPKALQSVRRAMRSKDTNPTPEFHEDEPLALVKRAFTFGEQGASVVRDFIIGNAILGTYTYEERLVRLKLDLMDLEGGKAIFGNMREMLGEEEFQKVKAQWLAAERRALKKHGPGTVGSHLTRMMREA